MLRSIQGCFENSSRTLTHVNEWEEIKKNNVAIAIISAALIVGLAIIMKDHVAGICEALIPYPEVVGVR